jgi:hypothetical protein
MNSLPVAAADPQKVRALMDHLLRAFDGYVSERTTDYLDALMAAHNFHKAIVLDLAERHGLEGRDRRLFLTMVDDTFHQAMEEADR